MNALFLIAAAAVAFAFGYRFYAKLLALDIFRLDKNYSTPAQVRADGREYVPTHPHLLFGHHVAAITGASTFAAPIVALAWGWIPVFLWITVGSAVAAGTYGLGLFWLAARRPEGLGSLAHTLVGTHTRTALLILMAPALLIIIAASAGFAASLLAAYPGAALPSIALIFVALALGNYLHGRAAWELLPTVAVAFVLTLLLTWLLGRIPLALNGALTIALGKSAMISIDAVFVWVVLFLIYSFHAARLPVWKLMRPRAFLTSLLLAVLLVLFYGATLLTYPALDAPEFHSRPEAAGTLPWLFLVVGSGALAGWQMFVVYGVTGRELRYETETRYIGYGAGLVQGLVALSALLLAATAFTGRDAWTSYFATAPGITELPRALFFYIDEFANQVAAFGLGRDVARTFAATVVTCLSLAVLEGAVRALKNFFVELAPPAPPTPGRRDGERTRLWLIIIGAGIMAFHDGHGLGGLAIWPILALISLWLAAVGFALVAFALHTEQRPPLLVAILGGSIAILAAWSSGAQLWVWWRTGAWGSFGTGVAILLLVATISIEVITATRRALAAKTPTKLDT